MSDRAESPSEGSFFLASDIGRLTVVEGESISATSTTEEEEEVNSNLTLFPGVEVIRERAEDFFEVTNPGKCIVRIVNIVIVIIIIISSLNSSNRVKYTRLTSIFELF